MPGRDAAAALHCCHSACCGSVERIGMIHADGGFVTPSGDLCTARSALTVISVSQSALWLHHLSLDHVVVAIPLVQCVAQHLPLPAASPRALAMQATLLSGEDHVGSDYIPSGGRDYSFQLDSSASSSLAASSSSIFTRQRRISVAAFYGLIAFAGLMTLLCIIFLAGWIGAGAANAVPEQIVNGASCQRATQARARLVVQCAAPHLRVLLCCLSQPRPALRCRCCPLPRPRPLRRRPLPMTARPTSPTA